MKVISNDADMICQVLNLNNTSTPSLSLLMNIGLVQVTGSWWHTHHTCCQDQLWVTGQCHQICHQGMTCDNGGLHPVTSSSYWGWCDDWTKMLGLIPHNKKKIQSTASKFFLTAKQHIESVWKVPTILPKLLPTRTSCCWLTLSSNNLKVFCWQNCQRKDPRSFSNHTKTKTISQQLAWKQLKKKRKCYIFISSYLLSTSTDLHLSNRLFFQSISDIEISLKLSKQPYIKPKNKESETAS